VRIRILTSVGGHACGAVLDVPHDDPAAQAWLVNGDAERIQAREADALETATPDTPETTMRASVRTKGRAT
jgi:hypothetical protein